MLDNTLFLSGTTVNAKSFFLAGLAGFEPTR